MHAGLSNTMNEPVYLSFEIVFGGAQLNSY